MKIGREAEGRFAGLLTLFLTADEALVFFDRPSLVKSVDNEEVKRLIPLVRHIYISDLNNKLRHTDPCFQKWMDMGFIVCIERTEIGIRDYWSEGVSFVLVVENEAFWALRQDDQVKFQRNGTSVVSTVDSMRFSYPHYKTYDIDIVVND